MYYRFLTSDDLDAVHSTFTAAFSDYSIRQDKTAKELGRMLVRRGVSWDLSVGAFDESGMVGVMAVGLGTRRGRPAAYDILTGVLPAHRGRGIAGRLLDEARPALVERGATEMVLEVLHDNERAVKAYRKAGFDVSRDLVCYRLAGEASNTTPEPHDRAPSVEIREVEAPDWGLWKKFWSWEPSWQNSRESVERSLNERVQLVAVADGRTVGYAIVLPGADDLPQMAVQSAFRRHGIGTRLLAAARARCEPGAQLRVINVDGGSGGDAAFWPGAGATEFARQFEMVRPLT